MKPIVPFLRMEIIEDEAKLLLAEFSRDHHPILAPPVPIDEIIELHLMLSFEVRDLRSLFGVGDVHGAIWFRDKRIAVDKQLDPSMFPAKRGRYHFTLAHETGHWRLHRRYFTQQEGQKDLFDSSEAKPNYICRSSEKKLPVEWQADNFAAHLLMPRTLIHQEWEKRHGADPIYLSDLRAEIGDAGTDESVLENAIRPLATTFQVSPEAMRIRAEGLGLLLRKKEASLF